jgi:Ran GTPase-activating protein (RanGAP) involved in mRNA processing and transport
LWRTLEEALPTTMTELYTKIILQIILRNIRKIEACNSVFNLSTFDALPADLQQPWWLLCEFAFQALEKDQLVFALEELKTFFPEGLASDKRILCFGLLQSAESIGFGVSFHFVHLTFQEYLAALHLARQSPDKQLDFFQSHKSGGPFSQNRFFMVDRFFFGIHHSDVNADIIQQVFECVAGNDIHPDVLSLCHCAFESHNIIPGICDQLTQYLISHFSYLSGIEINFGYPRTAHDCTAVIFVISNIQESATMVIYFHSFIENQIINLLEILADSEGKLQITNLYLSGNRLTISGLQALEGAVGGGLFAKLESLSLSGCLTSDADTNAAWLTTFAEALSAHCPHLSGLNLSDNNLGVPGVTALSKFFVTEYSTCDEPSDLTCTLPYINLNKAKIGDNGLVILIENVIINDIVVSSLSLKGNDIHSAGVSFLADAVCSGKLKFQQTEYGKLFLSDNPLGLEGSIAVARIISSGHWQSLYDIVLAKCDLTIAGINPSGTETMNTISSVAERDIGQQLCQMPQSSTVSFLGLSGNSFTGEGIHILAGFIHLCPCIKFLSTSDCGITSDDLIWLLDGLNRLKSSSTNLCSKLEIWYLHNNLVDDRGVATLIDHLPSLFPCLVYNMFSLHGNPVSSEMKKRLEEELRRCQEEVNQSAS